MSDEHKTEKFGISDLINQEVIIFLKNIKNIFIFINISVNQLISDNTVSRMNKKNKEVRNQRPRKQRNHHLFKKYEKYPMFL